MSPTVKPSAKSSSTSAERLDRGLSAALERWRPARAVHGPGKIVAGLAVTLALGGDCPADAAMLQAQPELFGPVASDLVVSWLVTRVLGERAGHAPMEEDLWPAR